mmetsp:Transcript_41548/g.109408  ORF Transcript_41548/g.109408 Transcript_41548/m.109408 type:complete len:222 (-) Transcript_41548:939-1604(-)
MVIVNRRPAICRDFSLRSHKPLDVLKILLSKLPQRVTQPLPENSGRDMVGVVMIVSFVEPEKVFLPLDDQLLHFLYHILANAVDALLPLPVAEPIFLCFQAFQPSGHCLCCGGSFRFQSSQLLQLWRPMLKDLKLEVGLQNHHTAVVVHRPAVVGSRKDGDNAAVMPHLEPTAVRRHLVRPHNHVQAISVQKSFAHVRAEGHAITAALRYTTATSHSRVGP